MFFSYPSRRRATYRSPRPRPETATKSRPRLMRPGWLGRLRLRLALLLLPIGKRGLDRVFRNHRAVNLHRRKRKLAHDVRVLDRERLLDGLALHPLGCE